MILPVAIILDEPDTDAADADASVLLDEKDWDAVQAVNAELSSFIIGWVMLDASLVVGTQEEKGFGRNEERTKRAFLLRLTRSTSCSWMIDSNTLRHQLTRQYLTSFYFMGLDVQ